MGSFLSSPHADAATGPFADPVHLVMTGLDGAGQTDFLHHLARRNAPRKATLPVETIIPLIGLNLAVLRLPVSAPSSWLSSSRPAAEPTPIDPVAIDAACRLGGETDRVDGVIHAVMPASGAAIISFDTGGGRPPYMHRAEAAMLSRGSRDGFIFVVDCADRDRFVEAREELLEALPSVPLSVPILILMNTMNMDLQQSPSPYQPRTFEDSLTLDRMLELLKSRLEEGAGRQWVSDGTPRTHTIHSDATINNA